MMSSLRRRLRVHVGRLAVLVAILALVPGCGRDSREAENLWPLALSPSDQLKPYLTNLVRISDQNYGDTKVVSELELFDNLMQGLYDKRTRRAASESLYETWAADPGKVLWPELAVKEVRFLTVPERVFEIFAAPVCSDSTTAIGAYMRAWRAPTIKSLVAHFELARERSAELDPFSRLWIELKSAYGARLTGSPELSITRALELLPEAGSLGGPRLESLVWAELARANLRMGELDDALLAAVIADTLATIAVPPGGARAGVLKIRKLRAKILAARRDTHAALALYERNVQEAAQLGLDFVAGDNLNGAATLAEAIGDAELSLDLDRRGLEFALSDVDSLNLPRHLMNIARSYRLLGDLDWCLVYQTRAERWVEAYPHPANVARLPLMQAEYYAQVGAYDVVDSLLGEASAQSGVDGTMEARAELHLQLIRGWMEIGRPDLVYRSIEAIADLRSGIGDIHADRHIVADLNLLIGEFLTRRGEFALADESLDLAAAALENRPNPSKSWTLARNRGLLDRARSNPRGSEEWFRECIRIGDELKYPELVSTGRLLLGSVRLDMGDYAGARSTIPSTDPAEFDGRFKTRVLALLLTGESYLREGDPDLALEYLEEAHGACRSWTPTDLVGWVELGMGRAHAVAGDPAAAVGLYEQVAVRIQDVDFQPGQTEELAYFNGDLRRDLVEAWLDIEPVDARRSLEFAMELRPRWSTEGGELSSPQIIFFVGKKLSGRWTVDDSRVTWTRLPGSAQITRQLAPILADMAVPGSAISESDLAEFSQLLLEGVEQAWPPGRTLHIVPDLELFEVPWAALQLSEPGPAVVEHGPVVILDRPISRRSSDRTSRHGKRLLVIAANSDGSSGLGRLRHAEKEALEVAAAWTEGEYDLRVGPAAASALNENVDLRPYVAIHVASHALVYSGRSDQTMLLLAGDGDNTTTVSRISELEVSAELVFLSACEAGDGGEARSVHSGLARSFQDAGASQVIAPISAIDDAAAREIAVGFYEQWSPGVPVAESLRAAQLKQKNGDRSHPFYWAFYQVFGEEPVHLRHE